ncbi:MAG TPA: AgmX/PglI C-terminal domain-containing protein [Steroidobacteraceae bacterium]|jgi:TonB family protein
MTLAPYYRLYELPWSPTEEVERRFRRTVRNAFIVFAVLALLVQVLPVPEKTKVKAPAIPDRIVKLLIEKKVPPPPPVPPKVEQKELPKPVEKVEPTPVKPAPKVEDAREKAQKSGLLKLQDQLADLRDNTVLDKAAMTKNLTGKVGENTSSERSLITSKVGASSGGINTAALSRGYGSGAGSLTGHNTTQVTSAVLAAKAEDGVKRGAGSTKAARSREEIELIFDRNKGAIYALYSRALRDKPELKGKLVLELTIAPSGDITRCEVISSELNDPDLERKLVARVKLFKFEARDVETITTTKPIDFFPA